MVRAINKHGEERYFTERVWEMLPKHKNGWMEWTESGELIVPLQIQEFQAKLKSEKADVSVAEAKSETPKVDIEKQPPAKRKPIKRVKR